MENPLSAFNDAKLVDEIFQAVCAKLVKIGKTVILASQIENVIIRGCD